MTDSSDTMIITVPLCLLTSLCGSENKPGPVLANRLNRLLTLTFLWSLDFRNILPQILYLLQAKTGQSHTLYTLSYLSYLHSRHSCHSVCSILYRWALRVAWPVNSPTAALSLNLLITGSSLALANLKVNLNTLESLRIRGTSLRRIRWS
jgi:hypothetical protein